MMSLDNDPGLPSPIAHSWQAPLQRASDIETIEIDDGYLILSTRNTDVVSCFVRLRKGKALKFAMEPHWNSRTVRINLSDLIQKPGVYDILVQTEDGKRTKFGASLGSQLTSERDRLIGTRTVMTATGPLFVTPYISYTKGSVHLLASPSEDTIDSHVFGLLFARVARVSLQDNILRAAGVFLISGVRSADCKVSLVLKSVVTENEFEAEANLEDRPEIQQTYATGDADYLSSGFRVRVNLDRLIKRGMVDGHRCSFVIRIRHNEDVYEKLVTDVEPNAERFAGKIKNLIDVRLERNPTNKRLYLVPQRKFKIDVLQMDMVARKTRGTFSLSGFFAIYGVDSKLLKANVVGIQRNNKIEFPVRTKRTDDAASARRIVNADANYDKGSFSAKINVKELSKYCFDGDRFVDFYLEVKLFDIVLRRRIPLLNTRFEHSAGEYIALYKRMLGSNDVTMYATQGRPMLSMSLRERLSEDSLLATAKERLALAVSKCLPGWGSKAWLTYETYSATAQDNSFYFYQWMRDNVPDQPIYYVIRKDSKDLPALQPHMSNVVFYYSLKHLVLMLNCRLFVSAQGRFHAYKFRPTASPYKDRVLQKKFIFLQHGVTAFKKSSFPRHDPSGGANLVMTVSKSEKQRVMKNWGYKNEEVVIAGFSRFDALTDKSDSNAPVVLVMPTWRNWLEDVPQDVFDASDFAQNYRALLTQLDADSHGATVKFYIHIKLAKYVAAWTADFKNIKIVLLGEGRVNDMLMEASVLVTDYSSVAWDFLYMNKPTVFFHFDLPQYRTHVGSFVNLEKSVFGPRAEDPETAVALIKQALDGETPADSASHFAHVDRNNSLRIYRSIISRFGI